MQVLGFVEFCGDVVECTIGPKDVVASEFCGRRGCVCDPCRHKGHQCNGGRCQLADDPNCCENFNLIFCVGGCLKPTTSVELVLRKKCSPAITKSIEAELEDRNNGRLICEIEPGTLAEGWWEVTAKLTFSDGRVTFLKPKFFRVKPCPTSELTVEPCESCDC